MITTGENEVLREQRVPVPLCPPKILQGLACNRSRASAVR